MQRLTSPTKPIKLMNKPFFILLDGRKSRYQAPGEFETEQQAHDHIRTLEFAQERLSVGFNGMRTPVKETMSQFTFDIGRVVTPAPKFHSTSPLTDNDVFNEPGFRCRHLIGTTIGTVTLEKECTIKHRRQSEFAAWSTDLESVPGTYQLKIGWSHYDSHRHLVVYAELLAVVTDDNCAPHFGGVAIGPASKDRVGNADTFIQSWDAIHSLNGANSKYPQKNHPIFVVEKTDTVVELIELLALEEANSLHYHMRRVRENAGEGDKWSKPSLEMLEVYAKSCRDIADHISTLRIVRRDFVDGVLED